MSGSAGDVVATDTQVQHCLQAILRQLSDSGIANNYDSLAHALDELDMWGFVNNQARVTAQYQAFSCRDNALIHQATMAGAFA